jgi:C_GCAxxG_C_C family probable redox protein
MRAMDRTEKALDYFLHGYNCAQATAMPFAHELGLEPMAVSKMMAGFGAGMGGLRGTCGAVSAMAFVAGLKAGDYPPNDNEAKKEFYDQVKDAVRQFKDRFQTDCCKDLLLKAGSLPKPDPAERDAEYYAKRPCAHFVAAAADIIEQFILE